MDRIVERGMLYDFYGELLTEHQKSVYEELVYNDMSLSEIAGEYDITRQAAHDLIRRCDKLLNGYEEKLHLIAKFQKIMSKVEEIEKTSTQDVVRKLAGQILEEI